MYINVEGNKLELDCSPDAFKNFHNGRALVKIIDKWGYINTEGKLIIPAKYKKLTHFKNDRAFVMDEEKNIYLINPQGEEIDLNELKLDNFKEFSKGLARVVVNGKWGFINTEGKMAIEAKYEKVGNFQNGLAWVRLGKGKTGYINKQGEIVVDPVYDAVKDFDPASGLALVKAKKEWFYIDKDRREYRFDIYKFNDFSEGLLRADKSSDRGKYGFLNSKGEWVIEPKFESADDFKSGICRVKENGLWGVINTEGEYIIEPKYDRLEEFKSVK
jgi:hypothetical protein